MHDVKSPPSFLLEGFFLSLFGVFLLFEGFITPYSARAKNFFFVAKVKSFENSFSLGLFVFGLFLWLLSCCFTLLLMSSLGY